MNEEARKGVSPVVWLVAGVVLAGAPLGFYVWQLKGQLTDSQSSVAQLQTDKSQLEGTVSQLQASASQMRASAAELQANVGQLRQERAELVKPDLPMQVTFRSLKKSSAMRALIPQ